MAVLLALRVLQVIIFAAATSAPSPDKASKVDALRRLIAPLGQLHLLLLVIGLVVLGGMLFERAMVPNQGNTSRSVATAHFVRCR